MRFNEVEKASGRHSHGGMRVSVAPDSLYVLGGLREQLDSSHFRVLYTDDWSTLALVPADPDHPNAYKMDKGGSISAGWMPIPDDVDRQRADVTETTIGGQTAYTFDNPHSAVTGAEPVGGRETGAGERGGEDNAD